MKVKIACLQMASHPYNWDYNIEKATAMITEAANTGANICLLPEVFIPGYSQSDDNFRQGESLEGPTISKLQGLAERLKVHIVGSFIEKTKKHFYNTMFVLGSDGLLGTYHKNYVYTTEQKYWKRGKEASIVETKYGAIGLGICADMHYPQLWKQYAGKVDLVLISSAWPDKPSKSNHSLALREVRLCRDLPVQISKALKVPTAYCNACHPCQGELPFGLGMIVCQGHSKIIDKGTVLASIDSREEKIISALVETSEDRPEITPDAFKNWIKYPFKALIQKFILEKSTYIYSKLYYWRRKKRFLD